jgi:C-terminal processing protease CtpA/Prc
MTRNLSTFLLTFFVAGFMLLPERSIAQQPQMPDGTVDAATRMAVIDGLIKDLNESYVFPEIAKNMQADLEKRKSASEYDAITSSRAFADKLTQDLQAISKDKHLRVRFSAEPIPVRAERREPTEAEIKQRNQSMKRGNFGFDRAERLDGNIGYIELRGFTDHEAGAATVAAAMSFLANTDALIFDLRQNGGGSPFMVALVSSYLFGDKPVHLNDLYWRKGDKTDSFWTKPERAAVKFPDKDVYILTSNRTFSAAEEFTYNLKNLKRATIIGETTGGGAHPGGMVRLSDHFGVFIPTGRAINPITKTNWEGTGVEPDVKVPKEQALKTAYLMAAKKCHSNQTNENYKRQLKEVIDQLEKELDEIKAKK